MFGADHPGVLADHVDGPAAYCSLPARLDLLLFALVRTLGAQTAMPLLCRCFVLGPEEPH